MQAKQDKSFIKKSKLQFRRAIRRYPTLPYILKWTVICSVLGLSIGSTSAFFLQTLTWVTDYRENNIWLISLLPIAGFCIGLLYYYFGKQVEAGNNLLIDTIHEPQKRIPFCMAPLVYIGTIVTHLFGGSAGREGTALQMAGAIADQFSKPFGLNKTERRILIIAAISAGFGSVFGTPLAGAIFGLEVYLIGRLRYNALFPAFAAAIFADIVTKLWGTPHTHYHIDFIPTISFIYFIYAAIAGVLFGLCAAVFSKTMHKLGGIFKAKISYQPLRPFLGGILVLLLVWAFDTTSYLGLGIPTIERSFSEQLPFSDFALKMLFTVITLSAGFKGGEVTPLFFIGATLGSALSFFLPLPVGLLAGMGFVAVFAGATNTPIACSIMAMELFGIECGVFVVVACVVSYLVSGHQSIYTRQVVGEPKHPRFKAYQGERLNDLNRK